MRRSSSLRYVVAGAALSALAPSCLLFDLGGLTGASQGDGGFIDAGGTGDTGPAGDAQQGADTQGPLDAPGPEASDANGNGDAPDVIVAQGGGDAGEAGPLSYSATVLADGPIAYWRLDDTTTAIAKDSSGHGHDGSYQGGVTFGATGIPGDGDTAVSFDGTGQMTVSLPSAFDFAGNVPYSIELWAMPASGPTSMGLVGKSTYGADAGGYSGWYLACASDDTIDSWRNNDETGNPAPAPGVFLHIVSTYDGTNLSLYVNGQPFSSDPVPAPIAATNAPLIAGTVTSWGTFVGVLDEIAIYDKALTQKQIATHYARGTGQ